MDWEKIRTEYVTSSISYRKLAEKHKISFDTLKYQARENKWHQARQEFRHNVTTKSLEEAGSNEIDYKATLYSIAYDMALKLQTVVKERSIEELAALNLKPRDITNAVKDIGDILHIKSAADLEEQKARIANLKRQAESDTNGSTEVSITFGANEEQNRWAE